MIKEREQGPGALAGRHVLIVDDEEDTLDACSQILRKDGCLVDTSSDAFAALQMVKKGLYEVVVADVKMPRMDGLQLLKAIKQVDPGMEVVMITGYATVEMAVECMKAGAFDYLPKPFMPDELRLVIRKVLENQELVSENIQLKEMLQGDTGSVMLGESKEMKEVFRLLDRVAATDSTVLILGETGTGKELAARRIHQKSRRADKPFIAVNCAAIPANLLESELFGHERGAFTGALRRKKGSFELANRGTLFLDEIGDLSLELQAKLMRAIQYKEISPVGSETKVVADTRILAATNRDLKRAVAKGEFREELYYRLNVIPVVLPPLRGKKDDIPLLAHHFLKKYSLKHGKQPKGFSPAALDLLKDYSWPGNIRELENAIERAIILEDGEYLGPDNFRQLILSSRGYSSVQGHLPRRETGLESLPTLEEVQRNYIMEVLQATRWNRKKASQILGISTVTLWRKVDKG
ncbi:MAG: sigma-54-dependent transcriptional regulator [Candidatus Binatia bacterium]